MSTTTPATAVPCPTCNAPVGELCHYPRGLNTRGFAHGAREVNAQAVPGPATDQKEHNRA